MCLHGGLHRRIVPMLGRVGPSLLSAVRGGFRGLSSITRLFSSCTRERGSLYIKRGPSKMIIISTGHLLSLSNTRTVLFR